MPLCINPICLRPENPEDRSICEACGSHLLLQNRYRVMNVLHQREDRVTTLYDVVDVKDQDNSKVLKVLYTKNQDTISGVVRQKDESSRNAGNRNILKLEVMNKKPN
jgi:hypothetical protein